MPHPRSLLFTFTLAVALMLGACRDGSAPAMALSIDNITPSGLVGTPGQEVQFVAMVDDATITTAYAWSVTSGGGTWDNSSAEQPILTLGSAATYTVTLTVTEGMDTDTATVSITVSATPVVTGVVVDPASGLPLGTGMATATVVGEFDDAEWDFGGGGETGDSGSLEPGEAITDFAFQDPGTYDAQVRAHGAGGWGDWFPVELTVEVPVAPEWTTITAATNSHLAAFGKARLSLTVSDGKLAVLYNSLDGIAVALARVTNPVGPADFVSYVLDPDGLVAGLRSIASYQGRLAVIYRSGDSSTGMVWVAIAEVAEPTSVDDWTIYSIDDVNPGVVNNGASILSRGDRLAVLWGTAGNSTGVRFGQTDVEFPDAPGDWGFHHVGSGSDPVSLSGNAFPAMAEVAGKLVVSHQNGDGDGRGAQHVTRSIEEDPEAPDDWVSFSMAGLGRNEAWASDVTDYQGVPAITYTLGESTQYPQVLRIADSAGPSISTDFGRIDVLPQGGWGGSLAVSGGRLAVAFGDQNAYQINCARQIGVDPLSPLSWQLVPVRLTGDWALPAVVVEFEGHLVVAYVESETRDVKLAFADGPF